MKTFPPLQFWTMILICWSRVTADTLAAHHPDFAGRVIGTPVPLPQQSRDYSPQGVSLWQLTPDQEMLLVSKKKSQSPSLLSLFHPHTGEVLRRFTLLDHEAQPRPTGVGGIAVAQDHLFIVSQQAGRGFIGVLSGETLRTAWSDPATQILQPSWIPIEQRASVSLLDGGRIWAIAFVYPGHTQYGFDAASRIRIDGRDRPRGRAYALADLLAWTPGNPPPPPVAEAAWPEWMQGAAIVEDQLWLSRSWSTRHRHLERHPLSALTDGNVGAQPPEKVLDIPFYGEGLWTTAEGHLWMVFEGGTPSRRRRLLRAGHHVESRALRFDPK